jgi:hypothetical protein
MKGRGLPARLLQESQTKFRGGALQHPRLASHAHARRRSGAGRLRIVDIGLSPVSRKLQGHSAAKPAAQGYFPSRQGGITVSLLPIGTSPPLNSATPMAKPTPRLSSKRIEATEGPKSCRQTIPISLGFNNGSKPLSALLRDVLVCRITNDSARTATGSWAAHTRRATPRIPVADYVAI